eukprot:CAMPEP_0174708510 /NCGR_PEP_ID=MMETSP1094-20130205/10748_1 /TAXON_ID=156173 /ORGANISM="Chrysochromulina brevifilum, Strain UTEX LB 985" /LENGTH=291 /DNA_ID=CAMNT_0015907083 /DNA_START=19 /DNA_END=894 /DNA_ORIENTATION=-
MAHLAPSWPDQTLCKENKRRALVEQQRRWMQQRQHTLSSQAVAKVAEDDDLDSLEDMNGFLANVGRSLVEPVVVPPVPSAKKNTTEESGYAAANSMLRDLHLARHGTTLKKEPVVRASIQPEPVNALLVPLHTNDPVPSRSQSRSAAQRAAAERLVQPKQMQPKQVPAPLIGSEGFYRQQQEGIRRYRVAYDARIGAHFDELSGMGTESGVPPVLADAIGALAHENASRHMAPVSQYVRGEASSVQRLQVPSTCMVGFTSAKTAGRRGGRTGRSNSIQSALQAAKDRGSML